MLNNGRLMTVAAWVTPTSKALINEARPPRAMKEHAHWGIRLKESWHANGQSKASHRRIKGIGEAWGVCTWKIDAQKQSGMEARRKQARIHRIHTENEKNQKKINCYSPRWSINLKSRVEVYLSLSQELLKSQPNRCIHTGEIEKKLCGCPFFQVTVEQIESFIVEWVIKY